MSVASTNAPDPRRYSPSAARNKEPILSVLRDEVPNEGTILEIGSGSGEHAVHLAGALPALTWQPTDRDETAMAGIDAHVRASGHKNILKARVLDVMQGPWNLSGPYDGIFCANVIHIAPWAVAKAIIESASEVLVAGAPLIFYGPFSRNADFEAMSNVEFDRKLRAENPDWGIRDLEAEVQPLAEATGFRLAALHRMPSNNLTVVFR